MGKVDTMCRRQRREIESCFSVVPERFVSKVPFLVTWY